MSNAAPSAEVAALKAGRDEVSVAELQSCLAGAGAGVGDGAGAGLTLWCLCGSPARANLLLPGAAEWVLNSFTVSWAVMLKAACRYSFPPQGMGKMSFLSCFGMVPSIPFAS